MVEWLSMKRMVFVFIFLGGFTVFLLILENYLANEKKQLTNTFNATNLTNEYCWLKESYEIINDCEPCTNLDIAYGYGEACKSRYRQVIKCKSSGLALRSCDKFVWFEEKKFWIFHLCVVVSSVASSIIVYFRQKTLNRQMFVRMQNQLS